MAKPFWSASPSQLTTAQWALLIALVVGFLVVVPPLVSSAEQKLIK